MRIHTDPKSGTRTIQTTIPVNTCHPGENVQFHSRETPRRWTCAKCGNVIVIEDEEAGS